MAIPDNVTKLSQAIKSLTIHGFPTHTWTTDSITHSFLFLNSFCKGIRVVANIPHEPTRSAVIGLGVEKGFFTQPETCTPLMFYEFCEWMRKPVGQQALREIQQRLKLERKAKKRARHELETQIANCHKRQLIHCPPCGVGDSALNEQPLVEDSVASDNRDFKP